MLDQLPMEEQLNYHQKRLSGNQIKYAMIVIITVPIIAVYPMFQKYFTKDIMFGLLKG